MTVNVTSNLPAVVMALVLQGVAAGAFPPGICALSFGIVGSAGFPARASRNEIWKHIGAILTAGLLPIMLVDVSSGGWKLYFAVMVRAHAHTRAAPRLLPLSQFYLAAIVRTHHSLSFFSLCTILQPAPFSIPSLGSILQSWCVCTPPPCARSTPFHFSSESFVHHVSPKCRERAAILQVVIVVLSLNPFTQWLLWSGLYFKNQHPLSLC
jgi:hypothetical protein